MRFLNLLFIILCLFATIPGHSQETKPYYYIKKGIVYGKHKEIGHSYHINYVIHKNPSYLTYWKKTIEKEDFFLFPYWSIFFRGHSQMRLFEDNDYDPVMEQFEVIGEYYAIDQSNVYSRLITNEGHPHGPAEYYLRFRKLEGADVESFEIISRDGRYGRDTTSAYFMHYKIDGVDLASFEVLGAQFKSLCRTIRLHSGLKMSVLSGAGIARDKQHVYWNQYILEGVNPNEFDILSPDICLINGMKYQIINYKTLKLIEQ